MIIHSILILVVIVEFANFVDSRPHNVTRVTGNNLEVEHNLEILFPDSPESELEPIWPIQGTANCAEKATFCESFDRYPYQYVEKVLKDYSLKTQFFSGVDEEFQEVEERMDESSDGMFICKAVHRIIFPKVGKTINKEWKYIINQGKENEFVQGIRVETCSNAGGPCDFIQEVPQGFTASCRQKYIYRKLLSLDENGVLIPDWFQLPSACCCSYKRNLEFLVRFKDQKTPI